jgi:hypothetical protein
VAEIGALTGASAIINSIRSGRGGEALRFQAREQLAERLRARKVSSENLRETRNTKKLLDKQAISRLLIDDHNAVVDREINDQRITDASRAERRQDNLHLLNVEDDQNLQQLELNRKLSDESFLQGRLLSSPGQQDFLNQQRLDADRQASDERFLSARQANAPGPEQPLPRGSIVDFQA